MPRSLSSAIAVPPARDVVGILAMSTAKMRLATFGQPHFYAACIREGWRTTLWRFGTTPRAVEYYSLTVSLTLSIPTVAVPELRFNTNVIVIVSAPAARVTS